MLRIYVLLMVIVIGSESWAAEISFKTADNATIYANYQQRRLYAVLLAHGALFNKESWGTFEQRLLEENYTVLAIDFRGYGKSTKGEKPQALYEGILAGIRFLRNQQNIDKVTVLGASMGGAAAAKADVNSEPNTIDQLILLSPARVFKPEGLKGQLLFIASKEEYLAKGIESAFKKAPEPKKLQLISGKAHAQHIFKTSQGDDLTRVIIDFLKSAIYSEKKLKRNDEARLFCNTFFMCQSVIKSESLMFTMKYMKSLKKRLCCFLFLHYLHALMGITLHF